MHAAVTSTDIENNYDEGGVDDQIYSESIEEDIYEPCDGNDTSSELAQRYG